MSCNCSASSKASSKPMTIKPVAKASGKRQSSEKTEALAKSLKEYSPISYVFNLRVNEGFQISEAKLNDAEKAMLEQFNKGSYEAISVTDREEVLALVGDLAKASKEELSSAEQIKLDLRVNELKPEQKAYMEHLRQATEQLHGASNGSVEGLIGLAADKLPQMLIPAVIGAIIFSIFGGSAISGAMAAGAISLFGSSGENATDNLTAEGDQKKIPPPNLSSLREEAAA